jgi:pSer/pThr/pTyr-binding forkhead associated (FHA) protein
MDPGLALHAASSFVPSFLLKNTTTILGRSSKCDFVVTHDSVSRRHAELAVVKQSLQVEDLNSKNGVFVDGDRVQAAVIGIGQIIRFGNVAFLLTIANELSDQPESGRDTNVHTSLVHDLARSKLSKAQYRVLLLLLEGLREKQVARRLNVSPTTVHNHVQAIYGILQVHSRPELLALFLKQGAS